MKYKFTKRRVARARFFVPRYDNYYHFMTESAMGLYRILRKKHRLKSKTLELWYEGNFGSIVQLFSRYPIMRIGDSDPIPSGISILIHRRPKISREWKKLRPMFKFLADMIPYKSAEIGITLIKRKKVREYLEHDELRLGLETFGLPVRDVQMELLAFEEQVNLMRNTVILVGPHGSGETNMVFMPKQSLIIELYPKGFSDRVFRGLADAFQHKLVEIESQLPSVIGRKPSQRVQNFIDICGWPSRKDLNSWRPDRMELGRFLRDVSSFSIPPAIVLSVISHLLMNHRFGSDFSLPRWRISPCVRKSDSFLI